MKPLFSAILLIMLASRFHPETFGQKPILPSGLSERSTIPEILQYLNETSFPHARIGFKYTGHGSYNSLDSDKSYLSESAIFSQGFKLVRSGGCHVLLINDDVKLLDFSSNGFGDDMSLANFRNRKSTDSPYVAEFSVWLERASHTKGKRPFLHTTNPAKAKLFGAWRVEYKNKGFFKKAIFTMQFRSQEDGEIKDSMSNDAITFTFDNARMSEQFDAAFRRVIELCNSE